MNTALETVRPQRTLIQRTVRQLTEKGHLSTTAPNRQGEQVMAIGSAIERGSVILVYDQRGQMLFSKANGSGPRDGLLGFTGSTVTVRSGSVITTYGEYGQIIYTKAA